MQSGYSARLVSHDFTPECTDISQEDYILSDLDTFSFICDFCIKTFCLISVHTHFIITVGLQPSQNTQRTRDIIVHIISL